MVQCWTYRLSKRYYSGWCFLLIEQGGLLSVSVIPARPESFFKEGFPMRVFAESRYDPASGNDK
jgi:hypothetical protein